MTGNIRRLVSPAKGFGNRRCYVTVTNWIGVRHVLAVSQGFELGFRIGVDPHPPVRMGRALYQLVYPSLEVFPPGKRLKPLTRTDHHFSLLLTHEQTRGCAGC